MKAIIIGNGEIKDRDLIHNNIKDGDFVICCDGGLRYAFEEGITPNVIIGDFDSVSEQVLKFFEMKNVPIKRFPKEKDFTDMELCIEFAAGLEADEILILGGMGSRFDHTLANANILMRATTKGIKACLMNENNRIYLINDKIELEENRGTLVSLLPLSEVVKCVKSEGLYYNLDGRDLKFGVSIGVSNVMLEDKAKVSVKDGFLFVILAKD